MRLTVIMGLIGIVIGFFLTESRADDFFEIQKVEYVRVNPGNPKSAYVLKDDQDSHGKKIQVRNYLPVVYARVTVSGDIFARELYHKIYFYDEANQRLGVVTEPAAVRADAGHTPLPPKFFKKKTAVDLAFVVPEHVVKHGKWKALVVFGDRLSASAKVYPTSDGFGSFEFAEKPQVENLDPQLRRRAAIEPLIEHVVKTKNPQYPQLTMFVRPPIGMTDASDAKGVLAICLVANDPNEIRRRLQGLDSAADLDAIFQYAERRRLILLCWGAQRLWNPRKNWNELEKAEARASAEKFEWSARAWAWGVEELHVKYGIPKKNLLLWGISASAQYACRLALRHPEYFLAVNAHVASSFDQPVPEARRILWCVTTGELESGYGRSLKFYQQCRELGYPILYKAVIGLGHSGSKQSENVGLAFFDYALGLTERRIELDDDLQNPLVTVDPQIAAGPWPEEFRTPPLVGDAVNQEVVAASDAELIPSGFRVPLPTKAIADAWREK